MVLLALLTGCTHRTATPPEDSLYRCYAEREDLKVAQLNGFKLNDTVRVDVIMLQADDEQAWQQLAAEFDVRGDDEGELAQIAGVSYEYSYNGTTHTGYLDGVAHDENDQPAQLQFTYDDATDVITFNLNMFYAEDETPVALTLNFARNI